jgi:hypothetical protein
MNLDVSLKPIKVLNTFKVINVFHNKEPLIILKYLDPKAKNLKTFSVTFLSKTQKLHLSPFFHPSQKERYLPLRSGICFSKIAHTFS